MSGTRTLTQGELLAEAKSRFGGNPLDFAFTCPNCGDTAAIREFPPEHRQKAGQECIGRCLGALSVHGTGRKWDGRGCDWTAYGLIPGPWAITMADGHEVHSFPLAEAASMWAQDHGGAA